MISIYDLVVHLVDVTTPLRWTRVVQLDDLASCGNEGEHNPNAPENREFPWWINAFLTSGIII